MIQLTSAPFAKVRLLEEFIVDECVLTLLEFVETLLTLEELLNITEELVVTVEPGVGGDESELPPHPIIKVLAAKKHTGSKIFFSLDSIKYINAINSKKWATKKTANQSPQLIGLYYIQA